MTSDLVPDLYEVNELVNNAVSHIEDTVQDLKTAHEILKRLNDQNPSLESDLPSVLAYMALCSYGVQSADLILCAQHTPLRKLIDSYDALIKQLKELEIGG